MGPCRRPWSACGSAAWSWCPTGSAYHSVGRSRRTVSGWRPWADWRPDWVLRWVATPQRHITYISVMQVNFPHNKKDFQNILTGEPIEQIEAIRDTLMNYPRVLALPVNRQWNPNFQAEKKE